MAVEVVVKKNSATIEHSHGNDSSGNPIVKSTSLGTMTSDPTDFTDQKLYNVAMAVTDLIDGVYSGTYRTSKYAVMEA